MNDDEFILDLNRYLEAFSGQIDVKNETPPPVIWLMGMPRSGTTLAMQLLTTTLPLGFVNNLIARFWRAPEVGVRLSQLLQTERYVSNWQSNFGKTDHLLEPHEFSYFWNDLLEYKGQGGFDPQATLKTCDWHRFEKKLTRLLCQFDQPVIFKTFALSYFLPKLEKLYPKCLFVFLDRPLVEVACSLAAARIYHHGDLNQWWSIFTPNYEDLKNEPFDNQICEQVQYYDQLLNNVKMQLSTEKIISIQYENLCLKPHENICNIATKLYDLYGYQIAPNLEALPKEFNVSSPRVSREIRKALELKLSLLGLY